MCIVSVCVCLHMWQSVCVCVRAADSSVEKQVLELEGVDRTAARTVQLQRWHTGSLMHTCTHTCTTSPPVSCHDRQLLWCLGTWGWGVMWVGVWAQGYMAHGTHGCQGHFDLHYTPTCRVWRGRPYPLHIPFSHQVTHRLTPHFGPGPSADLWWQVNPMQGLWVIWTLSRLHHTCYYNSWIKKKTLSPPKNNNSICT